MWGPISAEDVAQDVAGSALDEAIETYYTELSAAIEESSQRRNEEAQRFAEASWSYTAQEPPEDVDDPSSWTQQEQEKVAQGQGKIAAYVTAAQEADALQAGLAREYTERCREQMQAAASAVKTLIAAGALGDGKIRVLLSGRNGTDPGEKPMLQISVAQVDDPLGD